MIRCRLRTVSLVACVLAGAIVAPGAFGSETGGSWRELDPVEQGIDDVDPLSASLRDLQHELRTPFGFQRVYRVPGRDDLLMRAHGGLYAVFPRSWYERTRRGTIVMVPPQTIFFIGQPTAAMLGPAPPGTATDEDDRITSPDGAASRLDEDTSAMPVLSADRLGQRLDPIVAPRDASPHPTDGSIDSSSATPDAPQASPRRAAKQLEAMRVAATVAPRIIRDEGYRTHRLRELMRRAAGEADHRRQQDGESQVDPDHAARGSSSSSSK
jgi:hypothetical protein